jgi:murein DD-endopeptidase MepM/ murein hydrolase activator NlpD
MPGTRRPDLSPRVHTRRTPPFLKDGAIVSVLVALTAGLLTATTTSASADRPADAGGTQVLQRAPATSKPHHPQKDAAAGTTDHGSTHHGTDTRGGGDGSAADRDLALAASWQVDPTLLQPQPGDSAATLDARARLAAVTDRIHVVMGRYEGARTAAHDAAEAAIKARAELKQAHADVAAAHRVYVRDHRLLVQLITTNYEQPPVTPMQIVLSADNAHDMMIVMGTMEQVGSNQDSVVTEAEAASAKMRETARLAQRAADAARLADQKAEDALAAATQAGHEVLRQLDKARDVLTLSVLADQMQTNLAQAMKYANQLKPGSVSFPLPPNSGFYDNHNWGERSKHWASIHTGDDYSVACGTPVLAATGGKIEILTDQKWAGPWLVMVSTGQGKLTTWYAHMEALGVTPGQHVKAGQVIGRVGQEGNATGCHLHFELHPDGGSIYQDTTDPDPWLKAVGAYPGS